MYQKKIEELEAENHRLRQQLKQQYDSPGEGVGGTTEGMGTANMCARTTAPIQTPEECIDYLFAFHDDPAKVPHYVEIWEAAKALAKVIVRHTPGGQDRVTAINKLREVVMFANACVALDGRGI